jgi:hypothetical protein
MHVQVTPQISDKSVNTTHICLLNLVWKLILPTVE